MSKVKQYNNLLKQMFELLDRTEESENGRTIKPNIYYALTKVSNTKGR